MARRSVALVALSTLLLIGSLAAQEDPQLRQKAAHLLEHAIEVSQPPTTTPSRVALTFQWFAEGSERPGQIVASVVPQLGYKRIYDFGDYHAEIAVHRGGTAMTVGNVRNLPAPLRMAVLSSTPNVAFDHEDVIRSIDRNVINGRQADCIQFETSFGDKHQQNEACVDAQNGTLLHLVVGAQRTEYSDWHQFAGSFYPSRVDIFLSGKALISMTQEVATLDDPEHALDMPPGATLNRVCEDVRRQFAQNMPQPPAGLPGAPADIAVHGTVGLDGRLHDAAVDTPGHTELHSKALEIAAQWTFTPAYCNGHPAEEPTTIVLHFR